MSALHKSAGLALSTVTLDQWERIKQLFEVVLGLAPDRRAAFLDENCAGNPTVRADVENLLAEYEKVEPLVESTVTLSMRTAVLDKAGRVTFTGGEVLSNRFRIVRLLGMGGMGEVYEAEDLIVGERVALKTIRWETAGDARAYTRFVGEVHAAQKIAHPNICRIHDIHQHQPETAGAPAIHFLTMELLEGETLAARLGRSGAFTMKDAASIAEQLCAALSAAHRAGVVHRDFKAANVILTASPDGSPRAVVTDFGLARTETKADSQTDSMTGPGHCVGTPAYMAPEQVLGGKSTPAIDIYALGIVLYEMVTGTQPFAAGSRFAVMMKRLQVAPPSPRVQRPDLPLQWESAILRCLKREPQDRFHDAAEVWSAVQAQPARVGYGRSMVAALALAAFLVVGGAATWFLGRHRPPPEALRWYEEGTRAIRDGTYYTAMQSLGRAIQADPAFTLAHARLAEAASELDYSEKANAEMLKAAPPAFSRFLLSRAERIRLDAVYCSVMHDFTCAAERYKTLLNNGSASEKAAVLVDLGNAYEKGGNSARALASYSDSAARDGQFAAAFLRRGIIYARRQERPKAESDLSTAEQLYRTQGKTEGLSEVLYQRWLIRRRVGEAAVARPLADEVLRIARSAGDEYHQIRALLALSYIDCIQGNTTAGQQWAEQAVALARRGGVERLAASALVDVGNALYVKGENEAAEIYLRDAMQMANRNQALHTEARAAVALAGVLPKRGGRTEEALALAKHAQELFERAGYRNEAVVSLIPVGRILRDKGDLRGAAALFQDLIPAAEQINDRLSVALAELGLGSVLVKQEQYPAALPHFDASLVAYRAVSDKLGAAYALADRAELLAELGRYREAAAAFDEADGDAQRLANKPLSTIIRILRAEMMLSQRRPPPAPGEIRRLLEAEGGSADAANARRVAGLLSILSGRVGEGLVWCEESVRLALAGDDRALLRRAQLALAEAQLAAGQAAAAADAATAAAREFVANGEHESAWRALALAVRGSPNANARAKLRSEADTALERLRQTWGPEAFTGYESRPDVQWLKQQISKVSLVK